jgi:hypothetical protein
MLTKRIRIATVVVACACCAAWVGSAGGASLPQSGTLDLLDGADVVIDGLPAGSETGYSVAAAGDVNGDGRPDMLIGARRAPSQGRETAGAVFVVFGRTEKAPVDLANLGTGGFRIDGAAAGDEAGSSVASAGDLNGDKLADIVIGAPGADPGGDRKDAGAAYVVLGKASGSGVDLADLGTAGYRIAGAAAGDSAGFSVSSVADLDGDSVREILVGAPKADVGERTDGGRGYVVFGNAIPGDVDLASLGSDGYALAGAQNGHAGWSIAGSPDMNGDGKPEVLIGAPYTSPNESGFAGTAYAVWGKSSTAPIDLADLGDQGFELHGGETGGPGDQPSTEAAGGAVAPVGDTNADGIPDFAVGGQLADRGALRNSGSVYIVYGRKQSGSLPLEAVQGGNGWRIDGANAGDQTGATISSAGDFDGDGLDDIVIAAPLANPFSRQNAGASYVVFGRKENADVDLSAIGPRGIRIAGAEPGDVTSRSVAGIGDMNGDGGPDILLGSVYNRTGDPPPRDPATGEPGPPPEGAPERQATGAAYVVYGPRPEPDAPPPDPGEVEEVVEDKCVAARNVEAIIDDSGSMEGTDPDVLRRLALEILLTKPRNQGEVLGAVEFGSTADQLFPPLEVRTGQEQAELLKLLEQELLADNGGTNYNAAFAVLADENPGAAARIFLTDGGHNEGEYALGHLNGPPTYVIGLGIGRRGGDAGRLQRIASETGGRYFPSVDRGELQTVLNGIDSVLNCDIELETLSAIVTDDPEDPDEDEREDDVAEWEEELDEDANSADVVVSWDDEEDDIEVDEMAVEDDDGDVVQRIQAKSLRRLLKSGKRGGRRGLRVQGFGGDTYQSFRLTGLREGTLSVRVKAKRVRGKSRVRAQISQSRRLR